MAPIARRILLAAAAGLGPGTLLTPERVRAENGLRAIGDDGRPVAPSPPPALATTAAKPLSQLEVERRLQQIPVIALVNEDDSPYFTSKDGGSQVGGGAPSRLSCPSVPVSQLLGLPHSLLSLTGCCTSDHRGIPAS